MSECQKCMVVRHALEDARSVVREAVGARITGFRLDTLQKVDKALVSLNCAHGVPAPDERLAEENRRLRRRLDALEGK